MVENDNHFHIPGQAIGLQFSNWKSSPVQFSPPLNGPLQSLVLDRDPSPQVTLQADHCVHIIHTPSTIENMAHIHSKI